MNGCSRFCKWESKTGQVKVNKDRTGLYISIMVMFLCIVALSTEITASKVPQQIVQEDVIG